MLKTREAMLKAREAMMARRWIPVAIALAALGAACGRAPTPVGTPSPAPTASAFTYAPTALRLSAIEIPADAVAGQPVTVTVTVVLPNACTEYRALATTLDAEANRVVFSATGAVAQQAVCAQILTFEPVAASFTPPRSGRYTLVSDDGEVQTTLDVR
jgi:hypothetical protein